MNLVNTLIIVAVVTLLIFIIKFLRQIRWIKQGRNVTSRGSVIVNWLLVIIFIASLTGAGFSKFSSRQTAQPKAAVTKATPQATSTADDQQEQPLTLKFRNDVTMDSDNAVRLKITVSAGTKVVIEGRNTGKKYTSFTTAGNSGTVTKTVVLEESGPYKVIASRNGKKLSKDLIVRDNLNSSDEDTSTSSSQQSVSTPSSSSSSSTASSTSSRSVNNNLNQSNQTATSSVANNNAQ